MSRAVEHQRAARRRSMLPGSRRDRLIAVASWALPAAAGLLAFVLVLLPVLSSQEFSFLLSKDSAEQSGVRMAVEDVTYRGETDRGEPFEVKAESGIQQTSTVPVVTLSGLSAAIRRADGPATVTAPEGQFLTDANRLIVNGPLVAKSAAGYRLEGSSIEVDLDHDTVTSAAPVSGEMPMGTFRADRFSADIKGHSITMEGGVRLRLQPEKKK